MIFLTYFLAVSLVLSLPWSIVFEIIGLGICYFNRVESTIKGLTQVVTESLCGPYGVKVSKWHDNKWEVSHAVYHIIFINVAKHNCTEYKTVLITHSMEKRPNVKWAMHIIGYNFWNWAHKCSFLLVNNKCFRMQRTHTSDCQAFFFPSSINQCWYKIYRKLMTALLFH